MEDKVLYIENLRKKVLKHLLIIIGISFVFTITIVLISLLFHFNMFMLTFLPVLLWVVCFFILSFGTGYYKEQKEYKLEYKKIFVQEPFSQAFDRVSCSFKQGISKDVIDATDIIMLGNRYYSNDHIKGSYKDVDFERSDIKIQNHTSNGKTSNTVTYFHGRWLIFEYNKKFHFDLQIIGNGFHFTKTQSGIFTGKSERRSKIELEDIRFNQEFTVYAQDDHEAFYILTPQFMDTLKSLSANLDGNIMLGFIDNKLHVAINTRKDAMESSLFRSELNNNHIEAQEEINVIKRIINGLNLDRELS